MRRHERRGRNRIAVLERVDQVLVIVDHPLEALFAVAEALQQRREEKPVPVDDRECSGISGRVVDDPVELPVRNRDQGVLAGRDMGLELRLGFAQTLEMLLGPPFRGPAHEHRLHGDAHVEEILDEVGVERAHPGAAIGLDHHEAFPVEDPEGLAHRHVADPVARRQIVDQKPRSEGEHTRDDVVAKPGLDVLHGPRPQPAGFCAGGLRASVVPPSISQTRIIEPALSSSPKPDERAFSRIS